MKKILLYGDSIRRGYDCTVHGILEGQSEVYYPENNGRFAAYTLRYLHEWPSQSGVAAREVDCLHWNAGLWDCMILYDDGPMTPLPEYANAIARICRRIERVFPHATPIFATSTPVRDYGWDAPHHCIRYNADIRAYNETACEIVSRKGHRIDDLYTFLADAPDEWHSDTTHFYTLPASVALGRQVTSSVCDALGIDVPSLTDDEIARFVPERVTVHGI